MSSPQQPQIPKEKKLMCLTWDEVDKSDYKEDPNEDKESISCFMALSNEVPNFNSKSDNSIDQFDVPSVMSCHMCSVSYMMVGHFLHENRCP